MATPHPNRRFNRVAEHPPFIFLNRLSHNAIVVKIPAALPHQQRLEYAWLLHEAPVIAKSLDMAIKCLRELGEGETADRIMAFVIGDEEECSID